MDDDLKKLAKLFDETPRICEKCGGVYEYSGAGEYVCKDCGHVAYDDYGKVRKFIDEHGPAPYHVVKKATGVDGKLVREYLDSPKQDNKFARKCLKCGCAIVAGKYCSACEMSNNFTDTSGKGSKYQFSRGSKNGDSGGMHFFVERNGREKE